MGLPTVAKTWTVNPNVRSTFASLNDSMSVLIFETKKFLVTTLGATLKYTCDGTTGPTSSSDHTDRLASKANCTTRFNGTAGAQSFWVVTLANGVDVLMSYNGATDDVATLRFSPGGNYTPAGTANQEPTATDEVIVTTGTTLINATASLDRVYWFLGTTDKTQFRVGVFRNSVFISIFGVEAITSALVAPATWSLATGGGTNPVLGFFHQGASLSILGSPTCNTSGTQGSAAYLGSSAKVHTSADTICSVIGGGESYSFNGAIPNFTDEKPILQGQSGHLLFPLQKYTNTTNATGKIGSMIDWWYALSSAGLPNLGDTYGSLQFVALGPAAVWPWDGVTTPVIA